MRTVQRLAIAAILVLVSPPARAQVAAPSLVEEDLAEESPPPAPRSDREPEPSIPPRWEKELTKPAPAPRAAAEQAAGGGRAPVAPRTEPSAGRSEVPPAAPAATRTTTPTANPTATATPTPTATATSTSNPILSRKIEPVTATVAELRRAWSVRRKALREQDVAGAEEAERKILSVQAELGIEALRAFSAAEIRDSHRALAAHLDADAVAHAELAVKLAPGLPEAHLAVARAAWARDRLHPGAALRALGRAASAAVKDPYTSRSLAADLGVALAAALVAAGAAATLVLLLARLPLFLHDFHDLPLVRAGTPVQAALLAIALLLLPVALGLGPLAALAACAAASWAYLRLPERLVVTVALLSFALAPLAAERAARAASFTGTLAQDVWETERGVGDDAAARLAAREERDPLPPAALAALAGHEKRRGDLEAARRWYDRAIERGGRGAEVLVNLGNVHLLRGDAEAAKAAWLDAADRAGPNLEAFAAAQLNLAKLYVRQSSLDQAQEARRRAAQAAPELVERRASEDDARANRWLLDVPVPDAAYRALAAKDPAPAAVGASVRASLSGGLPGHLWPWAPLGLVALLWLSTLATRWARPSQACEKCGRPACARCDSATSLLCGQCVNVFLKKGVVDARDRLRKDQQVRRHARLSRLLARAGAILGGGAGHLLRGQAWRGFAVLAVIFFAVFVGVLHRGLLPAPQPAPALSAGRLAGAVALGAIAYAGAVRDVFRRSRG